MIPGRIGLRLARRWARSRQFAGRGYIERERGFEALVVGLAKRGVDHLFLHWPGAEVEWPGGEEMILLIADEHYARLSGLLRRRPRAGDMACRLYTVGGLPGSDRNDVAFLPVNRARELLEGAKHEPRRLASDEARLLALCTESVYHLGASSGLPITADTPVASEPGSRQQAILALNQRCGRWPGTLALGLCELDARLEEAGWRPLSDTLLKLSRSNPWLRTLALESRRQREDSVPGLAVYLVRERGLPFLDYLRDLLDDHGFDILCDLPIDTARRVEVADQVRGGNWGHGPYPTSGGLPAHLLVVHDLFPLDASPSKEEVIDNARVFTVKERMRARVNRDFPARQRFNCLHSSDNASQALEYLGVVAPERVEELLDEARRRNESFRTPYPVLANLSKHARRAKVELVQFHGTRAVCKTFRPGRERFLRREVKARELGEALPEVSRILEVGDRHLVFEWYPDCLEKILSPKAWGYHHGMLPIWAIERLRAVILHYRSFGYECIDLNPHNLIYDPAKGLKIIDFEFLQPGPETSTSLNGNYAWYPVPRHFPGDVPPTSRRRPYLRRWFPYTGLPRVLCLSAMPRPLLVLVRSMALVPMSIEGVGRRCLEWLGSRPSVVGVVRRLAGN